MIKKLIICALFFTVVLSWTCSENPLLNQLQSEGQTTQGESTIVNGLNYCKNLEGKQSCCSAELINSLEDKSNKVINDIKQNIGKMDKNKRKTMDIFKKIAIESKDIVEEMQDMSKNVMQIMENNKQKMMENLKNMNFGDLMKGEGLEGLDQSNLQDMVKNSLNQDMTGQINKAFDDMNINNDQLKKLTGDNLEQAKKQLEFAKNQFAKGGDMSQFTGGSTGSFNGGSNFGGSTGGGSFNGGGFSGGGFGGGFRFLSTEQFNGEIENTNAEDKKAANISDVNQIIDNINKTEDILKNVSNMSAVDALGNITKNDANTIDQALTKNTKFGQAGDEDGQSEDEDGQSEEKKIDLAGEIKKMSNKIKEFQKSRSKCLKYIFELANKMKCMGCDDPSKFIQQGAMQVKKSLCSSLNDHCFNFMKLNIESSKFDHPEKMQKIGAAQKKALAKTKTDAETVMKKLKELSNGQNFDLKAFGDISKDMNMDAKPDLSELSGEKVLVLDYPRDCNSSMTNCSTLCTNILNFDGVNMNAALKGGAIEQEIDATKLSDDEDEDKKSRILAGEVFFANDGYDVETEVQDGVQVEDLPEDPAGAMNDFDSNLPDSADIFGMINTVGFFLIASLCLLLL